MKTFKLIYRLPFGKHRTIGIFFLSQSACPTITSNQWDCNHYLVWLKDE
ncbi:MAG: hypothetical protein NC411_10645 [Bacteroides sp.]|nr:hypothetical protein [Bacteroides sp.]